jgi:glyoxylase-like metal-dependent hydrolase (beta-lactamase superfamily II)
LDRKRKIISVLLPALLLSLFGILFQSGLYAGSTESVTSIERFPTANNHFLKGKKAFLNGNLNKAEKEFKQCLRLFPEHSQAHLLFAQLNYQRSRYELAEKHIVAAKVNFDKLREMSKRLRIDKSNRQKAEGIMLRSALQQMQSSYDQYDCKKGISRMMSSVQDELNGLDSNELSVEESAAGIPADYYYIHGNIFYKTKRYQAAVEQYNLTLETAPYHTGALNNLCALYHFSGEHLKAWARIRDAKSGGAAINPRLEEAIRQKCGRAIQSDSWGTEFQGGIRVFSGNAGTPEHPNFENVYVVVNETKQEALIIDPGLVDPAIESFVKSRGLKVRMILNTHGHLDHSGGNRYYADLFKIKIAAHVADRPLYGGDNVRNRPDIYFSGANHLNIPGWSVRWFHTPGHTDGSVCYLINGALFSGDTLFKNGIGKISTASKEEEIERTNSEINNIKRQLLTMGESTRVFPGHGPSTTIGEEKKNNPFLVFANHSSQ